MVRIRTIAENSDLSTYSGFTVLYLTIFDSQSDKGFHLPDTFQIPSRHLSDTIKTPPGHPPFHPLHVDPFCGVNLHEVLVVTFDNKVSSQPDQFKLVPKEF